MAMNGITLNEKDSREARTRMPLLTESINSERTMEPVVAGVLPEVVSQVARMMRTGRERLAVAFEAYEGAKKAQRPTVSN